MSQKRERLIAFKTYAANLTACFPGRVQDTFLCPFCQRTFGPEALEEPPKVIVAHCVPRSLGGRQTAMACGECDSWAGTKLDSHLKNRLEAEAFFAGDSDDKQKVWLTLAGHRVRTELKIAKAPDGQNEFSLFMDHKHSHPDQIAGLVRSLESGEAQKFVPEGQFSGRLAFNVKNSRLSILRAAFLMMFRNFGYSYIQNKNLERVRDQINNPEEPIIPGRFDVGIVEAIPYTNCVGIITSPRELRSFFVPMSFRTNSGKTVVRAVVMPGLGDEDDSIYERLEPALSADENVRVDFSFIPYAPGRLSNPEFVHLPHHLWNAIAK